MKIFKRVIAALLFAVTLLSVFPLNASAASVLAYGNVVLKSYYRTGDTSVDLEWSIKDRYFEETDIERSYDLVKWERIDYVDNGENTGYAYINPKKITYLRVNCCYMEEEAPYNYICYAPSNVVTVYPKIEPVEPDVYETVGKAEISWFIGGEYEKKLIDGFDVFTSLNNGKEKLSKTVSVKSGGKDSCYNTVIKGLPKDFYLIKCRVKPYFMYNGKKYYAADKAKQITRVHYNETRLMKCVTKRNKITVSLTDKALISGYKIVCKKYKLSNGKTVSKKTLNTKKTKLVFKTDTKNYGYTFTVYPLINGKKTNASGYVDSHDCDTLMSSVKTKKRSGFKIVNTMGKKERVSEKVTLTKKDKKIIKAFFKKLYKGKKYPSKPEMACEALEWINMAVKYDSPGDYGNLRFTDAIFNHRRGQCKQYNGAFAMVLTYLGYEARLIEGYRFDSKTNKYSKQHYWCEVKLNGRWYLCEAGNNKKNPGWRYFVSFYRDSSGYSKFGKAAKD